jgi:hypothetical protein
MIFATDALAIEINLAVWARVLAYSTAGYIVILESGFTNCAIVEAFTSFAGLLAGLTLTRGFIRVGRRRAIWNTNSVDEERGGIALQAFVRAVSFTLCAVRVSARLANVVDRRVRIRTDLYASVVDEVEAFSTHVAGLIVFA